MEPETKAESKIGVGSVVWIRSGGPPMTVVECDSGMLVCVRFRNGKPKYTRLPLQVLVAVEDADLAALAQLERLRVAAMTRGLDTLVRSGPILISALVDYLAKNEDESRSPTAEGDVGQTEDEYGRALLREFESACRAAGVRDALLGVHGERDARRVVLTPGVLIWEQYEIIERVLAGDAALDALDKIMPGSGRTLAITEEQVDRARLVLVGAPPSVMMAFARLDAFLSVRYAKVGS